MTSTAKIQEIYLPIKDFEGLYEVSNIGNVKSLKYGKERILKPWDNGKGYLKVELCKNGKQKTRQVHQLVAEAFLGHIPDGTQKLVVNHKNFIKTDNRACNLEIVSNRENCNQKHLKSSSKFVGVSWGKSANKWLSYIQINGKDKYLGRFTSELEASEKYQEELKKITIFTL